MFTDLPPLPPALIGSAASSYGAAYDALAGEVVAELLACEWGVPVAAWRDRHPASAERRHVATPGWMTLDDRWDVALHVGHGDAAFYVLLEPDRAMCRLQRYRWDAAMLPAVDAARLHLAAERTLTHRFGAPERPAGVHAFGSASWHEIRRWRPAGGEVLLYADRDGPDDAPASVHILAKSPRLLREAAADWARRPEPVVPEREAELVAAVRHISPAAAAMLARRAGLGRAELGQAVDVVAALVRSASQRPRPERPIALIAADRLLSDLMAMFGRASNRPSAAQAEVLRRLASMGLSPSHVPDSFGWDAPRKLFFRAARDYPDTTWGQWAYLRLLEAGDLAPLDPSRPYQGVIRHANAFLAGHPGHAYRSQVHAILGMAYETWWTLCQPKQRVPYEPTQAERDGADTARQLAIKHYQAYVAAAPRTRLTDFYRWQAQRLELGYVADAFWYVGPLH